VLEYIVTNIYCCKEPQKSQIVRPWIKEIEMRWEEIRIYVVRSFILCPQAKRRGRGSLCQNMT